MNRILKVRRRISETSHIAWVAEIVVPAEGAKWCVGDYRGTFGGSSNNPVPPGNHVVRVDFAYDGGGIGKGATATLRLDGQQVAQAPVLARGNV